MIISILAIIVLIFLYKGYLKYCDDHDIDDGLDDNLDNKPDNTKIYYFMNEINNKE